MAIQEEARQRGEEASRPVIKKFTFKVPKYAPLDYLMFGTLLGLFVLSILKETVGICVFAFILGLLLGNKFTPAKPEMTEKEEEAQVINLNE